MKEILETIEKTVKEKLSKVFKCEDVRIYKQKMHKNGNEYLKIVVSIPIPHRRTIYEDYIKVNTIKCKDINDIIDEIIESSEITEEINESAKDIAYMNLLLKLIKIIDNDKTLKYNPSEQEVQELLLSAKNYFKSKTGLDFEFTIENKKCDDKTTKSNFKVEINSVKLYECGIISHDNELDNIRYNYFYDKIHNDLNDSLSLIKELEVVSTHIKIFNDYIVKMIDGKYWSGESLKECMLIERIKQLENE